MAVPKRGTPNIGPGGIPWGILTTNSRYNKRPTKIKLNNMSHILMQIFNLQMACKINTNQFLNAPWDENKSEKLTSLRFHKNLSDLLVI